VEDEMADAAPAPPTPTPTAPAVPEDPASDRLDPSQPRADRTGDGMPVEGGGRSDVDSVDAASGGRDARTDDPVGGEPRRGI
jgi:hypothetical protein